MQEHMKPPVCAFMKYFHRKRGKNSRIFFLCRRQTHKPTFVHLLLLHKSVFRQPAPSGKREVVHIFSLSKHHFCLLFTKHTRLFAQTHSETSTPCLAEASPSPRHETLCRANWHCATSSEHEPAPLWNKSIHKSVASLAKSVYRIFCRIKAILQLNQTWLSGIFTHKKSFFWGTGKTFYI